MLMLDHLSLQLTIKIKEKIAEETTVAAKKDSQPRIARPVTPINHLVTTPRKN